ncbi:MAG: HAD-IA family hydrolase [Actinobacteria bacterium]|nr:HAD-IA family hydrolase [Actinomycetota bacterium]
MTAFDPVLFDLDGTLIDTVTLIRESHRHAVRTVLGRELSDADLVAYVGRPLIEQMAVFSPDHADELYRVYRTWNHANTAALVRSYDGIGDVLDALDRTGRTIGVITSKSRDAVALAFASIPIGHRFATVVAEDDTARHKPNPEPILFALERLGMSGDRAVYVGDSPYDLRAARAAGIDAIGVTWGFFPRAVLAAERPTALVDTPAELTGVLDG